MTTLNGGPLTIDQQLKAIKAYGGLDKLGIPDMAPQYAAACTWAGNTTFKWGKQVASHLGGIRNPMVVTWTKRIKDKGSLRNQFTHCTDIAPTILEAAGLPEPKEVNGVAQMPMHGVSFLSTFDDANAPSKHTQQYFEILGNRAMYKDGWLACWRLDRIPWKIDPETLARFAPGKWDPDKDKCELYNLDEDFSLYVENGHLKQTYSMLGLKLDTISSRDEVPKGKVNVRYEFIADKPGEFATGGTSRLFINGKQQAEGKLEHTVPFRFASYAGMDIGTDNGLPVVPKFEYAKVLPKYFRGAIEKVEFDLGPAKTSSKDLQRMYLERFARAIRN